MCQLEAGSPDDAAEHFTKALTLFPELQFRPIAAYYLERMGKPVPPPPKTTARTAGSPTPNLDKPLMQSPLSPQGASPPASASGKADSPKTSPKPAEPAKSTSPGKAVSKEPASKGAANP